MFDNIGGKIKRFSEIMCGLGIGISCVAGVALIIISFISGENALLFLGIFMGILVGVVGSLLSWVSSFVMYGFGQLIENSDILVENSMKKDTGKSHKQDRDTGKKGRKPQEEESIRQYSEAELQRQLKNNTNQTENEFAKELKAMETEDLELILSDQQELYSDEELKQIQIEIKRRKK